jgi:NitT/TauT family transport system substrate-binding protein
MGNFKERQIMKAKQVLRRIGVFLGAAAFVSLVGAGNAFAQAAKPAKITVGIPYPNANALPIAVAQKMGYFDEENLNVEMISLSTGDKIAYALLGGSIEIGNYTPDWFIRAIEKGGSDLRIVVGAGSDLVFSLVTPEKFKSYADLKGQRIGVSTVQAADAFLVKKMFAANNLGGADYIPISTGSSPQRAAALKAGSLSATLLAPEIAQRLVGEGGFHRLDVSSKTVKHYAWGSQTVRGDWASKNRATLVAYIRAWVKGKRWLHDPRNEKDAIAMFAKVGKMDLGIAEKSYESYFGPDATVGKDGEPELTGFTALLKDMSDQGHIASPAPPPRKFIDASYWNEAVKSLGTPAR